MMKKKKEVRSMRTFGKVLLKLLELALVAVLVIVVVFGFYAPKYLLSKESYDVSQKTDDGKITIVSANARCYTPGDLMKKSWFYRAPLLVRTLAAAEPDIIGFQEVTWLHRSYFDRALKGYDYVLDYRDDSFLAESCPIYYNTSKFTLTDKGSFWLSETPETMSKGWNAACYRICSYVILTQKSDGKQLVVFNTHLDHVLLARGARVKAESIERSIVGVMSYIDTGTVIKNSIIMGAETEKYILQADHNDASTDVLIGIGKNCHIENAIIDKNARIGNNVVIKPFPVGTELDDPQEPKRYYVRDGIVVIPKNAVIESDTVIEP